MGVKTKLSVPIKIGTPSLGGVTLNVPQINQEQTQWCWAACADMVLHYYGNPRARQCDFANWLFAQSACCNIPSSSLCNRPCQVPDVQRVFSNWGLRSNYIGSSVPFATIQTENATNKPVEVGYAWNGGGGHVAIVRGYDTNDTGNFVLVNDPWYGSGGVYYNKLLTAYDKGRWNWTWTDIRR